VSGVVVWRCEGCLRRSFPRRELCPFCAGRDFTAEHVERGVATEVTSHRGVDLAWVRIDADVSLLARVADTVEAGADVGLLLHGGAPVATQ
jgi:uncharacterized OB-fold protein